jgi:hypothetical protein
MYSVGTLTNSGRIYRSWTERADCWCTIFPSNEPPNIPGLTNIFWYLEACSNGIARISAIAYPTSIWNLDKVQRGRASILSRRILKFHCHKLFQHHQNRGLRQRNRKQLLVLCWACNLHTVLDFDLAIWHRIMSFSMMIIDSDLRLCVKSFSEVGGNSNVMVEVGGFSGESWRPGADVRAFAELLLEKIERGQSWGSNVKLPFVNIFKSLKDNDSRILEGVDLKGVSDFVRWIEFPEALTE